MMTTQIDLFGEAKVEEKSILIPSIPGTKNVIYSTPPPNPGMDSLLNPNPRKARKNRGIAKAPTIRDFALENLFISLSHKT